jgi:hypothetical protein
MFSVKELKPLIGVVDRQAFPTGLFKIGPTLALRFWTKVTKKKIEIKMELILKLMYLLTKSPTFFKF